MLQKTFSIIGIYLKGLFSGDKEKGRGKIVLDPIHGMIHLDPLAVKIIDTYYFQRLRYIKQVSFSDFVYPGATHTRFAHSIGVYHLARQMIKKIKAQKLPKEAQMSPEEEKCICIAALCHDLGHGPFSHAYEEMAKETVGVDLKHENISIFLVAKLFNEKAELKKELGPNADKHIKLIQDLIQGKKEQHMSGDEKKKKYMFQIVSNKDTGVDVDKWDYFHRDAKACGVPDRFQNDRALSVARVVKVKGKEVFELGYRDYDAINFYNMFNTRFTLYRKVYKHKVVTAMSLMMKDVFKLVHEANKEQTMEESSKIVLFPIKSGDHADSKDMRLMPLGGGKYLDIDEYLKLRDDVFLKIQDSTTPAYGRARNLIQRIQERKLYKLVDVKICLSGTEETRVDKIKATLQADLKKEGLQDAADVTVVKINYGQENKDPVEKLTFYSKGNEEGEFLKRGEVSPVLTNVFEEYHVRVYEKFSANEDDKNRVEDKLGKIRTILEAVREQILNECRRDEGQKQMFCCPARHNKGQ